jgi:predicted DNA-binding protein (MmcQ/YjbR family)
VAEKSPEPRGKNSSYGTGTLIRVARAGRTAEILARLRAICMALPEAQQKLSHGEPTWFAGKGKVFAIFDDHHHDAPHVSVWLPALPGAQQILIANDPQRFWRPPYLGHRGWVAVVLDTKPKWKLVADLTEQGYRLVASPKLVAKLE